ncbi:MAG TPA: ABC transporter substrate-binding protein [Stellaceae bacterium]|jgi:NitT/TauT family transport system substrate-binding protein|nr:ABC transporter substrate-binding protein [Stellaceae bacterium]
MASSLARILRCVPCRCRRRLPALAVAACLGASLGAPAAFAGDPIRVGMVGSSMASIPIVVADAKGFFRDEGLDATIVPFQASEPIALAIGSGDIDFGTTGLSNPFFVLANAGKITIIGGDSSDRPGFHSIGFVASSQAYAAGLKSTADLGGRSLGLTQLGSPLEYSLARVLAKHAIDLKSMRLIGLQSNANVASALIGGQIDSSVMSSANLYAVVNRGAQFIGWVDDEITGTQVTGTVTPTKFANARPDAVRHFLAAFRKGAQAWDAAFIDANGNRADQPNAEEMIALMAKGLDQPADVIRRGINYDDPEARVNVGALQQMLDWYYQQGMQKTHLETKNMIDMRFAKLVPQAGG